MKSNIKAKFLQHLSGKKSNGGFTLIELLVVIIIIGILTAIALPSFLNQSNKAKLTEAKNKVRSAAEAQKAFYVENTYFIEDDDTLLQDAIDDGLISGQTPVGTDGDWFVALGVGPAPEADTKNYVYTLEEPDSNGIIAITADPKDRNGMPAMAAHKTFAAGIGVTTGLVDIVYCEAIDPPVEGGVTAADFTPVIDTEDGIICTTGTGEWTATNKDL